MCLACALVWAVERAAVEGATKAAKEMEIKAEEDGSQVLSCPPFACSLVWLYSNMCACMYACMHVCMYACMYACMYVCIHVCMHACMYACMYVCMHVCYACMHACMHVYPLAAV